ncbi:MAG: cation:proton antiporter [Muribaculaceae bacterium]|nr:cation:proton antiporter [Muribaculaceae bacterium]
MIPLSAALVEQPVQIFLIVLAIILLAPLLLNKLKIPHIIGMIAAGIIVGPYGFNILADDSSFAIFGQVGLLYLMFLAGLEIDMYHLRLNLRRGMVFGILTLLIPLSLGVLTSVYVLGLNWVTSMLLGAMYASHTLLSYPVAARLGVTKAPAVLIAIVGTIIAVIGALLVLGATVTVAREGAFNIMELLWLAIKLALWAVALLYLFPRLTRLYFKHYSDKVTQYVFVLTLVFLAAATAQLIGLEPVLGAFLAGLILNRYVPAASPLMNSIEFVGNALFIPYFLISVGMIINVRLLANPDTLALSAFMILVALAGKWLPAYIARRIYRMDSCSGGVMFGLTTAHTAVALAVVTVGYNLGMFDETVLNSTIMVIMATCAAAPMLTASAAAKLKVRMMDDDSDALIRLPRVNHTLIPVANAVTAGSLVEMAMLMRNDRGRHSFYALHVRNDNGKTSKSVSHHSLEAARRTGAAADIAVETLDRYDLNTVTGVLNVIEERDITEILLGMHRRATVIDSFFGTKVEQLLRSTNRMLLITRCFIPANTLTRILVWVPDKAQYETGFSRWVRSVARLTRQVGCRVIFHCTTDIQPLIRGVLYAENYGIRCEFATVADGWDDFILLSNKVLPDDLLVVVSARAQSVSYAPEMAELPSFLQKYYSQNNLMVIFPEQFGESVPLTSFTDPLSTDIASAASPVLQRLRGFWRRKGRDKGQNKTEKGQNKG